MATIDFGENSGALKEVRLYDLLGQQMLVEAINPIQQELLLEQIDHLPAGSYSLQAIDQLGKVHHLGLVTIVK